SLRVARLALSFDSSTPGWFDPLFWSFVEADATHDLERQFANADKQSWMLLALQGRRREALRTLDARAPPSSAPASARGYHHALRADYRWGDGDPELVWQEIVQEMILGVPTAMCGAQLLISLGDVERGERVSSLFAISPDHTRMLCPKVALHLGAWKRGDRDAAIRGLSAMAMPEATYHLGEVLAEAGRDAEAAEAFRKFRRWPEWDNNWGGIGAAYPLSLYREALSVERLGNREQALKLVDRLLLLWKRADDLPALREAKALRSRLSR
ncbi:MAG: tetratricopeptide repeat protein, partial [Myxococcales bacterium]